MRIVPVNLTAPLTRTYLFFQKLLYFFFSIKHASYIKCCFTSIIPERWLWIMLQHDFHHVSVAGVCRSIKHRSTITIAYIHVRPIRQQLINDVCVIAEYFPIESYVTILFSTINRHFIMQHINGLTGFIKMSCNEPFDEL